MDVDYGMVFTRKPWKDVDISGREGKEGGRMGWDEVMKEDIWWRLVASGMLS